MTERTCSINGCDKRCFCRGWCSMHYSRWQRHGDPLRENVIVQYAGVDFAELVDRSGGDEACHPWSGPTDQQGYGRYRKADQLDERAHREAYRRHHGEVPDGASGYVLDHRCHDPRTCSGGPTCQHRRCCNPAHLVAVPNGDNAVKPRNAKWGPDYSPTCSVAGCERRNKTNGLCDPHYTRFRKHGDTFPSIPIANDRSSRRKL
ncbi:HNH endonuclease signature motif containing protein [Streptomyces sp. NPDC021019]|uniref:HNH endonuclease signature motif containing protein n=1 Tax=Streptomyces sp. NPDC021019 TaxID=3365108 RepID=UPI00378D2C82